MRTLKIGTKIGGYQLLGLIARGGMGAVYEALEIQLERRVALKVIAPPNPDDHDAEELVQRFMQEARTLARVNHPNVITIYAIDTAHSVPFITMELVEGISFKELLAVSFLSADLAMPMFLQMLEGLQCLHDNRIVHRDLKPHNIMVRPDGHIKILDFGIAKPVDSGNLTHAGVVVGSLAYMAPEVKVGITATERSDLWNLGAIFYECLTGKPLIKAQAENSNPREIPYPANSAVPLEMRAIISKLCHHRPLERYESATQALEDMRKLQRSRPPVASDAQQSFARKVEEILVKRRGENKVTLDTEITPIKAENPPENINNSTSSRRERSSTAARTATKKSGGTGLWKMAIGGVAIVVVLIAVGSKKSESPNLEKKPKAPVAQTALVTPPVPRVTPPPLEPLKLIAPRANEVVWLESTAIPTLSWSREVKHDQYEIEIAHDVSFRKILLKEPIAGNVYRPAKVIEEGKYFWRLTPKDSQMEIIGPQYFTLAHISPIKLGTPAHEGVIETRGRNADVELTWDCKAGVENYQIEIFLSGSTKKPVRKDETEKCNWQAKGLAVGEYAWRVGARGNGGQTHMWSEVREFRIKAYSPKKPSLPNLAKPRVKDSPKIFTMNFKTLPRDLASVRESLSSYPRLTWSSVHDADKYLLQIARDDSFSKLVFEQKVARSAFEWQEALPGQYFWRVAALGSGSHQGPFSDSSLITVRLPAPKLLPSYAFKVQASDKGPILEWPAIPLASKYVVQMKRAPASGDAEEKSVSVPRMPLQPLAGRYSVKVAAADESGELLSAYSANAEVLVDVASALPAPVLRLPKPGATAVVRSGRLSISFEWKKVPDADSYILEMAEDERFGKVIEKLTSKDPSIVVRKVELSGKVYWRVRAEGPQGVSDWSEVSHFEVRK